MTSIDDFIQSAAKQIGAAGAAMGGGKATSLNLAGILASSGLDAGKAGGLVKAFLDLIQKNGGASCSASS